MLVLGIGNTLQRDEGVGVHALAALQAALSPAEAAGAVTFLDGGTLGLALLPVVEDATHLLILDAVDAHLPPGAVVELADDEIPLYSGVKLSQHQVTFQEVLALAGLRGRLPARLHLIGVQPADLSLGVDLSPTVAAVLPAVVQRAIAVLQRWGVLPPSEGDGLERSPGEDVP
ncbi:MAG: HyaD/HybD family hydrogenase maturation endopeptidase [Caldilineales bacterium]|nr:HyaD/HybD family hydrogenase maturation endopeptidase [Caldilineales bacterium]